VGKNQEGGRAMKQLLILSGKGGTGKTTVAASFIALAHAKAYADCDVDAPNLHLVNQHVKRPQNTAFYGMDQAEIEPSKCNACGICQTTCRFGAILKDSDLLGEPYYKVNPLACEGCSICSLICPQKAIRMVPRKAGVLSLFIEDSVFSTAKLKMGSGTSGKLVTEVKKNLLKHVSHAEVAIIDGSPGIGCPVIASMSGVDLILLVTEPTISGLSDLKRIVETAQKFQTAVAVCINKFDSHLPTTAAIEGFCQANNLPFVGKIPYDPEAVRAINEGVSLMTLSCPAADAMNQVYVHTMKHLETQNKTKGVQLL